MNELRQDNIFHCGKVGKQVVKLIDEADSISAQPSAPVTRPKPTDAAHIAHAGTEHEVWWDGETWAKPWPTEAAAPPAPPAPPAPKPEPVAPVKPPHDPVAAAEADGWIPHPDAPGHHYKGQEVVTNSQLVARYAEGNAAGVAAVGSTPDVPAASQSSASAAQPAASASTDAVPADVQNLLDKWGGNG